MRMVDGAGATPSTRVTASTPPLRRALLRLPRFGYFSIPPALFAMIICAALSIDNSALGGPVDFTFSGSGINGSTAVGSFTLADGQLAPNYFSEGGIFSNFSLTVSNIPGGSPTEVTLNRLEVGGSWLEIGPNGAAYIGPVGSKDYGAPGFNHYDLGQPEQPFLPSLNYRNALTYNGAPRDQITWSVATPTIVPEPESAVLLLIGAFIYAFMRCGRRFPAPPVLT